MDFDKNIYQSIAIAALAAGLLLLLPLLAMKFTDEVAWSLTDFFTAGILLFVTGLTFKLITRRSGETAYQIAVGFALIAGLFLLWANLAVGIIGSEDNPANLMYFGVLAVGMIGAFIVHFQPAGMSRTMFAMACAQALVAVIALIAGMHKSPGSSVTEILSVNGFFMVLFAVSALFFRYTAEKQTPQT